MKLKYESDRWFYNQLANGVRNLSAFVRDFPDHEDSQLMREAISELRAAMKLVVDGMRPIPEMPHLRRLGEIAVTATELDILDWNDRQARLAKNP